MMQSVPIFHESRHLQLRRTVPNDAEILYERGFSQREFMRLFRLNDMPTSAAAVHKQLVQRQQIPPRQETYLELMIVHRRHGPIGLCALADHSSLHRRAEYLVGLFETSRRQLSYGVEAGLMLGDLAFNGYNLNKLYASTYAYNRPAQKVLESGGFQLEGCCREHIFDRVTQQFVDLHNYGLTVSHFRQYQRLAPLSLRLLGRDITVPSMPPNFQARDKNAPVKSGTRILRSV
ncbi:MAG: GNAT family N-acetyltransferase [Leptolyngbyaceae cyanobacterium]